MNASKSFDEILAETTSPIKIEERTRGWHSQLDQDQDDGSNNQTLTDAEGIANSMSKIRCIRRFSPITELCVLASQNKPKTPRVSASTATSTGEAAWYDEQPPNFANLFEERSKPPRRRSFRPPTQYFVARKKNNS